MRGSVLGGPPGLHGGAQGPQQDDRAAVVAQINAAQDEQRAQMAALYGNRLPGPQGPPPQIPQLPPGGLKTPEYIDRIREEFHALQNNCGNLENECKKLLQEKTEMQRQYVMYYEMSFAMNCEMAKQVEISKRLQNLIVSMAAYLPVEMQGQMRGQMERAMNVNPQELQVRPSLQRPLRLYGPGKENGSKFRRDRARYLSSHKS